MQPKRAGNCGWYFKFLNWLSENGLSLDVCGRLCERVTPRSASSSAVALAFIGAPRSACSVSWPYGTRCFAIATSSNGLNRAALSIGHTPADHASAEDVEDDVEIEIRPFRRPHQLGDVPGPDLIGAFRQQLGLLIDGVAQLSAAFAHFGVLLEDAIHRADRAVVDALIEQGGVDFRRRLVDETWRMQ